MRALAPARGLLTWAALFGAAAALAAVWPETPVAGVLGFVVIFAGLAAVLIDGAFAAAQRRTWPVTGALAAAGVGLVVLAPSLGEAVGALVGGVGLVLAAFALGTRLGFEVQQPSYLWPLVVVALGADVWSVTTPEGVTRQVVEAGPDGVFGYIVLSLPVPGVGLSPVLGVGDVVFTALLAGAVTGLGLPRRRAALGLAIGFGACLLALLVIQLPLPALPFIAVAAAAALGRAVRPAPRELAAAVVFVAGFFVLRAALA